MKLHETPSWSSRYLPFVLLNGLIWGSILLLHSINNSYSLKELKGSGVWDSFSFSKFDDSTENYLNVSNYRNGIFKPKYKSIQWIAEPDSYKSDKGTYVLHDDDSYLIKSFEDKNYTYSLYNSSTFGYDGVEYEINSLVSSPNLLKALLKTDSKKNWRWSSYATYFVLDISTQQIEPLIGDDFTNDVALAKWSPNSLDITFIKKNNLFVKNLESGAISQVTTDGSANIFNGKPDWVYEEEVFGTDSAVWWSPQGDKLAFIKFNDTNVPVYGVQLFVQDKLNNDYTNSLDLKYPKPGYSNPIVDIYIYDLESDKLTHLDSEDLTSDIQILVTEMLWVSDDHFLAKVTTRTSDLLKILLVDSNSATAELIRKETADDGWFEITTDTTYIPKDENHGRLQDGYIDTVVINGYNHLAYFSPPSNPHGVSLTSGDFEVIGSPIAFDYTKNDVYFVSTDKSPIERHVYKVNLFDQTIANITDVSAPGWYTTSFSSGSRYLLLTYQGPDVPHQSLVDLYSSNVEVIEDNAKLADTVSQYNLPTINYEQVNLGKDEEGNDIIANSMETLPYDFDPSKKYPVLFFVYGGPGSQLVTSSFAVSFSSLVASELDVVVVTVDGRGTGFMNRKFRTCVRDNLGYYESQDQISAAKLWAAKEYTDESKFAIWGWSYGGYMTLKTLESDAENVFSYGMSVAPVTDWRLYDSVYTERYMHTPQENPKGYEQAEIHNMTNFKSKTRFLLMHGTGDDNVHFQHSLQLLDKFNLEHVENFDLMIFPDSDHSISYHEGNIVVYDRLLHWLERAFDGDYLGW